MLVLLKKSGTSLVLLASLLFIPLTALAQDADGDGMPDSYENAYGCLMADTADGDVDYDSDSLTSLEEYAYSAELDPCNPDTDNDLADDGEEVLQGSNPLDDRVTPSYGGFKLLGPSRRITHVAAVAYYPSVVWSGTEFGLAWNDPRADGVYDDIWFNPVTAAGDTTTGNLQITTSGSYESNPSLAWTGSEYGVLWVDMRHVQNPNQNFELYFARFDNTGARLSGDIRVTYDLGNSSGRPRLVWTGSEFGLAWGDDRDGLLEIYFVRLSATGSKIGSDYRVSNSSGTGAINVSLDWTGSEYGLAWYDYRDPNAQVYFTRISAGGTEIGSETRINYSGQFSQSPSLAWSGSEHGLVWDEYLGSQYDIYFSRIMADGTTVSAPAAIISLPSNSRYPQLVWAGDKYGMIWDDNRSGTNETYITTVGISGATVGEEVGIGSYSYYRSLAWDGNDFGLGRSAVTSSYYQIYFDLIGDATDSDGDGLADREEQIIYSTSPDNWDHDGDGMPDGWEVAHISCLDPLAADSVSDPDGDSLNSLEEYALQTNPCAADSDGDGMDDGYESAAPCLDPMAADGGLDGDTDGLTNLFEFQNGLNPCDEDTDGDSLPDPWEVGYTCTDPLTGDSTGDPDSDLLANAGEYSNGTDPCAYDTDGDGLSDNEEVSIYFTDPLVLDSDTDGFSDGMEVDFFGTNPLVADPDTDADGLPDQVETDTGIFTDPTDTGSDPADPDSDGDGFSDGMEVTFFFTDPNVYDADTDSDGLPDTVETNTGVYNGPPDAGTDPSNPDCDGDGVSDGQEVINGSNPLDPGITPQFGVIAKPGPDYRISNTASTSAYPAIAWTGSGFGVTWQDYRYGNSDIFFALLDTSAARVGSEIRETFNSEAEMSPDLAWNGSQFVVVYSRYITNNYEIYDMRLDSAGTAVYSSRITNYNYTSDLPAMVWSGSEFGLVWQDGRYANNEIFFAKLASGGSRASSDIRVSYNSYESNAADIAWSGSEYGIVWNDNRDGNYELYFMRMNEYGSRLINDTRISFAATDSAVPSMVWTGTEYGVAWQDARDGNNEIYFLRLSPEGTVLREQRITTDPADSTYPSLVWNGSEYGLSWSDSRDQSPYNEIYFTRISPEGDKIVGDFRVTSAAYYSFYVDMAWTGSEYGLAWTDVRTGVYEIYATILRIFTDSDGDGLGDEEESVYGTDPADYDTDDDGLTDGAEVNTYGTNPLSMDTDGDGMDDSWEVLSGSSCGIDPLAGDAAADNDGDGVSNLSEYNLGTMPCVADSDSDGMDDGYEVLYGASCGLDPLAGDTSADPDGDLLSNLTEYGLQTLPCVWDTDGDGMDDGWEVLSGATCGLDPLADDAGADPDADGLVNLDEYAAGTEPCIEDSDHDGITDGAEDAYGLDPTEPDTDGDGLTDSEEALLWLTDPASSDSDGDGMDDGWESSYSCLDPLHPDAASDPDGDGLDNAAEFAASSDPCAMTDTDGDGMSDWWEDQYPCVDSAVGDSLGDPDSDGRSNLREYLDRTDPCTSNLIPQTLNLVNYQGRLMDDSGVAVGGTVDMAFSLFDGETGGAPLWTEYHQVRVENGIYDLLLGGDTVIPSSALTLPELWLQVSVSGEVLVPRQKITAVLHAINADLMDGQRLETGSADLVVTAAIQATIHVSFTREFAAPPRVVASDLDGLIGGENFVSTRIFNVTATGFDAEWKSLSGAPASGNASFQWFAVGP